MADTPSAARGLGLAFGLPGRDQWRTATLNLPVFPDNSPRGFYDRLLASKTDAGTGKPDPAAMAAFLAAHPETAAAMAIIKKHPPTTGFADSTFSSLNAFYLVDAAGTRTPARWSFMPMQAALPSKARVTTGCSTRWCGSCGPARCSWRLHLVVGEPSDPLTDATLPWPPDRRVIDAGTLTLTTAETEAPGNARDVNFDPLVLPAGHRTDRRPAVERPVVGVRGVLPGAHRRTEVGVSRPGRETSS